jgi:hypothetical protein
MPPLFLINQVYWELYPSRIDAARALAADQLRPFSAAAANAIAPLVQLEEECEVIVRVDEVCGVACIQYDPNAWAVASPAVQRGLRAFVIEGGLDRAILDFSGQDRFGSASGAPVYSLYRAIAEQHGRMAICHVNSRLLDFFRWHGDPVTSPSNAT